MRGHVAGGTGIGVVAPDAAHGAGFFQQDKVVDASFAQACGHANTTEPAADDNDLMYGFRWRHDVWAAQFQLEWIGWARGTGR